jgi:hypothetical protein
LRLLSLEGQVPVFISQRNRVAQIYPEALGSLFVASYDSLGYGGGIRTRLHMGLIQPEFNLHNALQETHSVSITTANRLMLFTEIIAVYRENHMEHIAR